MATSEDQIHLEELIQDQGLTSYNRRLADKILNAFNQAMSVGRSDVAEKLEDALRSCIDEGQEMRNAVFMEKAGHWRRFVAAREFYKTCIATYGEGMPEASEALTAMRQAYMEWSQL